MPPAMPAPDARPDPAAAAVVALADRCVQCGLCLPVCPTYTRGRLEAESPRGRIALARAWALQAIEPTAIGDRHLDQCLGCRSCEAVCPAGVEYGALLQLARTRRRTRRGASLRQRLTEWFTARPQLLSRAFGLYRLLHPALPARLRPLPRPPRVMGQPATGNQGATTATLFIGCVAGAYEGPVRDALARLCTAAGVELRTPAGQGCCGAIHAHGGNAGEAARLGRRNREAFAGSDTVLTLASGCHEAVAAAVGASALDAFGFLDRHRDRLRFAERRERVALHLPCTQRNVVKSVPALRRLLASVPGLEVVELDAGFGCCGAAGTAMLVDPEGAAEYRQPLLEQFAASGATLLLSANIGCRLHLANGTAAPVQHPLELLAAAVR
ncbi:(Fe-S)-binding protein [Novilysobacter arseniciresistens]|uniref:(Fe-S)-binding protein n=1 Tax=Novilysobacter arseniciresistens TaxID=1385522 RepID=UPI0009DF2B6B|nr:(Fe-S)-binding protein [Lysobacter arseniciresistens]